MNKNDYRAIVELLVNKMITGKEAELYIQMIDNGYSLYYNISDCGGNEIDYEFQFTKRYTKWKNKSKQKGFL